MRLIDADKLNKKKKYSFQTVFGVFPKNEWFIKATDLFSAPTVDAVPVVRCKDCVNGTVCVNKQGAEYVDCVLDDYSVRKPTDYCPYGKRKEGAE